MFSNTLQDTHRCQEARASFSCSTRTVRSGATDLRDEISGILSLIYTALPYLKLLNYTSIVKSVYSGVTVQILQYNRSLRLLSAAGQGKLDIFNRPVHGLDIPSWVPDYSLYGLGASLSLDKTFVEPFKAGGRHWLNIAVCVMMYHPAALYRGPECTSV